MTRLHAVPEPLPTGGICGPYALAALTGRPPQDFMRPVAGRYDGMTVGELKQWLRDCGVRFTQQYRPKHGKHRMTVRRLGPKSGRGIICVEGHWLAFDGTLVMDTLARRHQWAPDHKCARQRIVWMLVVEGTRP